MKKLILSSLVLSLTIFMACNNSCKEEEIKIIDTTVHQEKSKTVSDDTSISELLETGQSFAEKTQKTLGKNLLNAINTKGTEHAVTFCNDKAYPLTDSMALVLNAQIKRVSDNPRNPKNIANNIELAYILKIKKQIEKGIDIKPELTELNGRATAYYPIITNKMCMQCHGKPNTEVLSSTLSKIKTLYPNDKALGYKVNELRGVWVIGMNKK